MRDLEVAFGDSDFVWKASGSKSKRVKKAVQGFGPILRNEAGRRVAVVAHRHLTVARLRPARELVAHHMTVRTRSRIVRHVRCTAGIPESKQAHPEQSTQCDRQQYRGIAPGTPRDEESSAAEKSGTRNMPELSYVE